MPLPPPSHTGRPPVGIGSIGTAVVLMAVGAVLMFAVDVPREVEKYVDVLDLGLILIWAGILILVMQVVMTRRPAPRGRSRPGASAYDRGGAQTAESTSEHEWYEHDVHRPGYAGETERFPTLRDR